MKRILLLVGGAIALSAAVITGVAPASGADHGDAPLSKANVPLDINDVYAFGGEGDNVVLAMTVNPLVMAGEDPKFDTSGVYQFKIDNTGDAVPDVSYNATFAGSGATQTVTLTRSTGSQADSLSASGTEVLEGDTTSASGSPNVEEAGGTMLFAGLRDDPFFFDLNAFKAGLAFRNPGNNFFLGLNTLAIVIEVPADDLLADGSTAASVWGVTSRGGNVVDRMGRPAINTVFIPEAQKDAFNNTKPANDVSMWKDTVVATLNSLGSDPALADALLPDVLTFDTAMPFGFLNGRQLEDDVIDGELQLITGNPAASDNVANDSTFLSGFPYLGSPNTSAAPTPVPVTSPTASAPAPAASPTAGTGVTAPDTGTGGSTGTDGTGVMWLVLGVAGAAGLFIAAGAAIRARNSARSR